MLKILEEHTPELIDTPKLKTNHLPPRKPLPVANNVSSEEDLSFEEVSQRSSEIDEKEARIIKFLEQEDITIANPKEKEWEYAQNVKQKAFLLHSKSKKEQKCLQNLCTASPKLQGQRAKIAAYNTANQAQEAAKGAAQQATRT